MGDSHRSSRKHKHKDKDQAESSSSSRRHKDQSESSRRHRDHTDSASRVSRRSGAHNDDLLQPQSAAGGVYGSGASQAQPSRFSLNSQFAATRQEIEFDFDDGASSLWDQGTDYGSVYQQQQQLLPPQAGGDPIPAALRDVGQARNFYELLCLAPDASMDEVRRAYYRHFTLLHPNAHPAKARQVAQIYWAVVQEAFETLSNPQRRLVYERDCLGEPDQDSDLPLSISPFRTLDATADRARLNLDHSLDTFDFGLRVDAEGLVRALEDGSEPSPSMLKPVDFFTSHSFSVLLPGLGKNLDMIYLLYTPHHLLDSEPRIVLTDDGSEKELADDENPGLAAIQPRPTRLTINSSIYGFMQDLATVPSAALVDNYQPCLPGYMPRDHIARLRDGLVQPLITLTLQHSLPSTRSTDLSRPIIELESDIIPLPAVGLRVTHCVALPLDKTRSIIQVATKAPVWQGRLPRLSALVQRPTAGGLLLLKAESGDWIAKPDQICHAVAQFSNINRRFLSLVLPVALPPRLDLAYTTQYTARSTSLLEPLAPQAAGRWKNPSSRRGVDLTVSANAEPGCLGSSAMLSTSLSSILSWPKRLIGKVFRKPELSSKDDKLSFGRRIRMEAGVSWTSIWASVLTLRCLRTTGRFSAFGFEIGLSAHNLHFSLCWSRLGGQTIRLPFLVCPASHAILKARAALLWSALVPFATLAAWELLRQRSRLAAARRREARRLATVQQRQTEADEVTFLLADNVQAKQAAERGTNGGLVILSAKYGVKAEAAPEEKSSRRHSSRHSSHSSNAWGSEEVADTTVAVAALVSDGRLHIPAGLEKSNLLGFWDPSPALEKVLHVRYTYQGVEGVVEVSGDEELRLPPVQ
ncbi:uncharacterized protein PG986_001796 [Apiospora aurea]|uniref:J domain-containing protein n=1 Tax=Apiospora aurea TaxID=335848 RepID=A0ABR1QY20_9PEZI